MANWLLSPEVLENLASGKYAFIDAGCGGGHSIGHCAIRFGRTPGLGLDWGEDEVRRAIERGFDAAWCDLRYEDLPPKCVEYSAMMDFLEHLPDEEAAVHILKNLARASRDFLFIRHPSFEDIDYLAGLGLKIGWTDWSGHPNMMKVADFERVFASFGWEDYVIVPHMLCTDSAPEAILPVTAPVDSRQHDDAKYGPKPIVRFDRPVYGKFDIFVRLNPALSDEAWGRITDISGWDADWDFVP
jgi:hypothetical protein